MHCTAAITILQMPDHNELFQGDENYQTCKVCIITCKPKSLCLFLTLIKKLTDDFSLDFSVIINSECVCLVPFFPGHIENQSGISVVFVH